MSMYLYKYTPIMYTKHICTPKFGHRAASGPPLSRATAAVARESGGPEAARWPNLGVHICLVYIMGVYLYRYMDMGVRGHTYIYIYIFMRLSIYTLVHTGIYIYHGYMDLYGFIYIHISVYLDISTISKFDVNGFS